MPVAYSRAHLAGFYWIVVIVTVYPASVPVRILWFIHYFSSEYKIEKASSFIQPLITESRYL